MNIAEEIDTRMPFPDRYLVRMGLEAERVDKEHSDLVSKVLKKSSIARENGNIISISEIVFRPERPLRELVERIKIDIRKKLRCEIAKRNTFPRTCFEASDDEFQQPHRPVIGDFLPKQSDQDLMIHRIKEFPNIELEYPDRLRMVPREFPRERPKPVPSRVRALTGAG